MMQIAPYVSERRKKRRRRRAYLFTALGIIALYLVFFVVQWFVFHSPVFRVDHVVVAGDSAVASSSIVGLVEASALPQHDIFPAVFGFGNMMLWPDHVSPQVLAMQPRLADIAVSKDYFSHTVTLTATDRTPAGMWCFTRSPGAVSLAAAGASSTASSTVVATGSASCFLFDGTGTIFQRSFDTQGNLIYVVDDSAQSRQGLEHKVLPQEFLLNFLSIVSVLRQSGLTVKAIDLTDLDLEEVDVTTANGPTIYFSLRFPADDNLPVIQKLMLQSDFSKLKYIDCRTQNRLYYK